MVPLSVRPDGRREWFWAEYLTIQSNFKIVLTTNRRMYNLYQRPKLFEIYPYDLTASMMVLHWPTCPLPKWIQRIGNGYLGVKIAQVSGKSLLNTPHTSYRSIQHQGWTGGSLDLGGSPTWAWALSTNLTVDDPSDPQSTFNEHDDCKGSPMFPSLILCNRWDFISRLFRRDSQCSA